MPSPYHKQKLTFALSNKGRFFSKPLSISKFWYILHSLYWSLRPVENAFTKQFLWYISWRRKEEISHSALFVIRSWHNLVGGGSRNSMSSIFKADRIHSTPDKVDRLDTNCFFLLLFFGGYWYAFLLLLFITLPENLIFILISSVYLESQLYYWIISPIRTILSVFFLLLLFFLYFFNFWVYLFIYLSMAVLGPHFCARALSSCGKWGPLFIVMHKPLTIAASPVAEHRLQTRRLSNCGSRA